jgi:hypothetical protein
MATLLKTDPAIAVRGQYGHSKANRVTKDYMTSGLFTVDVRAEKYLPFWVVRFQ